MKNNEMLSWLNYFWSRDIDALKKEIRSVIFDSGMIDLDLDRKRLLEFYDQEIDKKFDVDRLFRITESTEAHYREIEILEKSIKYFSERETNYQSPKNESFNFLIVRHVYGAKPIYLKPVKYNWKPIDVVSEFQKIKICKEILIQKKNDRFPSEEITWAPLRLFLATPNKEINISLKIDERISALEEISKEPVQPLKVEFGEKDSEPKKKKTNEMFFKINDLYDKAIEIFIKLVTENPDLNKLDRKYQDTKAKGTVKENFPGYPLSYKGQAFSCELNKLATAHFVLAELDIVEKIISQKQKGRPDTAFNFNEAARCIYGVFGVDSKYKQDIGNSLSRVAKSEELSTGLSTFERDFKNKIISLNNEVVYSLPPSMPLTEL